MASPAKIKCRPATIWRRRIVSPLPSTPSSELATFLSSCDNDVTDDVVRRARIILEAIFPRMGSDWAEQVRLDALKLYYRVLQAMCTAAQDGNNLTSLLTNERFHRCMLACSAELVLATHKSPNMLFPAFLERTGITPFDLIMAIESFYRHEKSLPRELRRHLNSLEERLLESMVWEKGSPVYNSSVKSEFARGETCDKAAVGLFFSKIMKLAAVRINGMAERMDLSRQLRERVFMLFYQILSQRTTLFFKRHIDHIILCALYAVQKVWRLNLSFEEILQTYLKHPNCKPHTVFVDDKSARHCGKPGQDHVSIIIFYNQVFIPAVKPLLVEPTPGSPIPRLPNMPRKKVSSVHDVYVSRLRSTKMDALITQGSKSYYAYFGLPSQAYKTPSQDLTAINNRLNVLKEGNMDDEGPTPGSPKTDALITHGSKSYHEGNMDDEGPTPGSPKVSTVPSDPPMPPKFKLNVSRLQSTKMDALITPGSKSYFAYFGLPSRSFQTPSQDLSAINNHLNGLKEGERDTKLKRTKTEQLKEGERDTKLKRTKTSF